MSKKRLSNEKRWYREGLKFRCTGCGHCCAGEPGYVWVNQAEIEALAVAVAVEVAELEETFVRRVGRRRSLRELPNGDCVFYDHTACRCKVYAVRPRQCRSWPFWHSNIRTPAAWEKTCRVCAGAGRGPLVKLEEIEARLAVLKL